jgi:hypothetical protein
MAPAVAGRRCKFCDLFLQLHRAIANPLSGCGKKYSRMSRIALLQSIFPGYALAAWGINNLQEGAGIAFPPFLFLSERAYSRITEKFKC